jgi:CheY-like chemotaxis protein
MSQTDTNHRANDTPAPVLNGGRIADPSRVFSTATSDIQLAKENHHASCETASICSRFMVKLSHQMRTRLGSIVGVTEMMLETSLTDAQKENLEAVVESAAALASMTEEIADFSRCLVIGAEQHAYRSEPDRLDRDGEPLGARAIGNSTAASGIGVEEMPPKNPGTGNRVFNGAANFRTRVPPDTAKQIRILLAEDHMMNQHVMLRMLARLGYTADAVCNGVEAVAALTRSPYDIVLMDCQMPELDGYEATRQIRRGGGRFRSTPIIAVTANAMEGDREKCLASGMSDYMSKPVLAHTLATTLEKWILPDAAVDESASAHAAHTAAQGASPSPAGSQPESSMLDAGSPKATPREVSDAIDAGAIETLRSMDSGDEGFMGKIIELFLSDLTERLAALKTATEARDGRALKAIAHAVKGSCGHFGAKNLAALCRKMEQIGLQQPVPDPSETFAELEAEAGRVRIALEETHRSSPPNSVTMEEPD